jgi:SAM-dependent methyltransferase
MDDFALMDLLTGYQQAAVIASGVRLGMFDALAAAEGSTAEQLAAAVGTAPAPTAVLLATWERLGLATGGPTWSLTPAGHRLSGFTGLALVSLKEAFFARVWTDLDDTIRTGVPRLASWQQRLADDPAQCRLFLRALRVIAEVTGPDLTAHPAFGPGTTVLDAGGGFGSYAVPLARAGAQVTIAELAEVAAWARAELAEEVVAPGSLTVIADDLSLPGEVGDFDAVLLSHVLHDLNDDQGVALLSGLRTRVRPGTALVVFELAGNSPGLIGPTFDLMMMIEGPGRARTAEGLIRLLRDAGWTQVEEYPARRPHVLVQAVA